MGDRVEEDGEQGARVKMVSPNETTKELNMKINTIQEALEDFREGKFVIVVDDEDRENEGDFIIAAEKITPEKVNFMLQHGRGVLCCPITEQRCAESDLKSWQKQKKYLTEYAKNMATPLHIQKSCWAEPLLTFTVFRRTQDQIGRAHV